MASSYTSSLRLVLPAAGENTGTWGDLVNNGITSLVESAIAGYASIAMSDADHTLTTANGASDEARSMMLNMTGTLGAARNVICPTQSKVYIIKNATTGGYAITLKTSAGTGISIPNGRIMILHCDGTNVVDSITNFSSLYVNNSAVLTAATLGSTYAPIASPTFTGVPAAPTAAADTNTTQLATTAYVVGQGYLKSSTASSTYAPLASPTFTGTPAAPTAAADTNTTQVATTAFVIGQGYLKSATASSTYLTQATASSTYLTQSSASSTYAPLASPTFTGTPAAPTAAADTNTTQVATTAYVIGQGYLKSSTASSTYAPLGGSGASGTWSISVTGSAASVSGTSSNGYGTRTSGTGTPSGGASGDIHFQYSA